MLASGTPVKITDRNRNRNQYRIDGSNNISYPSWIDSSVVGNCIFYIGYNIPDFVRDEYDPPLFHLYKESDLLGEPIGNGWLFSELHVEPVNDSQVPQVINLNGFNPNMVP